MPTPTLALRRLPLTTAAPALTRARLLTAHLTRPTLSPSASISSSPALRTMDKNQARGESTTGLSEWKQRPPYRIHEKNEDFEVKYEANCHCGRVKYQLSRREPLDSKLCHCTTCQTQHGEWILSVFGLVVCLCHWVVVVRTEMRYCDTGEWWTGQPDGSAILPYLLPSHQFFHS